METVKLLKKTKVILAERKIRVSFTVLSGVIAYKNIDFNFFSFKVLVDVIV